MLGESYNFPSYHRAIREPFDYYQVEMIFSHTYVSPWDVQKMANAYIGSLIDFERSLLKNCSRWSEIQQQLEVMSFSLPAKEHWRFPTAWWKRHLTWKPPKWSKPRGPIICFISLYRVGRCSLHSFAHRSVSPRTWGTGLALEMFQGITHCVLQVIYVAGGRVVSDILAKPFSMGKNLLCVVSKKHMVRKWYYKLAKLCDTQ